MVIYFNLLSLLLLIKVITQAALSSLQQLYQRKYLSLHGEPSNIALVNGGPQSQRAFLFFFPYQSILHGDFEAQVIIFFLYRQGGCLNSHIEGN